MRIEARLVIVKVEGEVQDRLAGEIVVEGLGGRDGRGAQRR